MGRRRTTYQVTGGPERLTPPAPARRLGSPGDEKAAAGSAHLLADYLGVRQRILDVVVTT